MVGSFQQLPSPIQYLKKCEVLALLRKHCPCLSRDVAQIISAFAVVQFSYANVYSVAEPESVPTSEEMESVLLACRTKVCFLPSCCGFAPIGITMGANTNSYLIEFHVEFMPQNQENSRIFYIGVAPKYRLLKGKSIFTTASFLWLAQDGDVYDARSEINDKHRWLSGSDSVLPESQTILPAFNQGDKIGLILDTNSNFQLRFFKNGNMSQWYVGLPSTIASGGCIDYQFILGSSCKCTLSISGAQFLY